MSEKIQEIRSFFLMNKSKAFTIDDVKETEWKGQPQNMTIIDLIISRMIINKILISDWKISKQSSKILRDDHFFFWETVIIQDFLNLICMN